MNIHRNICMNYSTSKFEDNEQKKQTPLRGLIRLVSHLPVSTNRETRVTPSKGTPRLMESWRVESSQFSFHATHRNASDAWELESYSRYQYLSDCIKMPPLGNLPAYQRGPKKNLCVRLFCITVLLKSCQTPLTMHDIHLLQNLAAILAQQETASLNEDHKINAEKMWKCGLNTFKYIIYIYITVHGKTIFHSPIWWCMM